MMKKIFSNTYIRYGLFVVAGLLLGWLFFHNDSNTTNEKSEQTTQTKNEIWTCSMHPQIKMDKPGKCPICGMDLIPLSQMGKAMADDHSVHFTDEALALANVQTTVVTSHHPVKQVRLFGKVQADERLLQSQTATVSGRIEKLLVNFTGEPVRKGQLLAVIYSPDLVNAQQELIEVAKVKSSQPELYQAAREKLLAWKLSEQQINEIERSGKVKTNFSVISGTSGIITAKRVNTGDYVSQGSVLFDVANLSNVWVLFDAYESDLAFLKVGDEVDFTVQALPGENMKGHIRFIDPVVDTETRVAHVRVEMSNAAGKLKPEMFAQGTVDAKLSEYEGYPVIPRSAVLWTGKRSVVYVKDPDHKENMFFMREVELGPRLGNAYVVLEGLYDGDEIVSEGAFSVDAASQLEGKPSMMEH